MRQGKFVCETLKTIRKQIADANEIKYEPRVCNHEGDCSGTCPACEAEVRYLERELTLRRKLGKAVAVVGISAGLASLTTSCNLIGNQPVNGMLDDPLILVDSLQTDTISTTVVATPAQDVDEKH
jgi:hypothetical protein